MTALHHQFLTDKEMGDLLDREARIAASDEISGPDASARDTKNGARAGAGRREDVAMEAVAQARPRAKQISFGIGSDSEVTDLSALLAAKSKDIQTEAEARAGYRHVGQVQMSIAGWDRVQSNRRQRDTELHARKAKHLQEYDPVHRFVSMAVLPDGRRVKLDGHTRAYVWTTGGVAGPETVIVDVYACDSEDITETLYSKFDSQSAVETGADKVAGAARRHGLAFETGMLKAGRYGSAIKRLYIYSTKSWNAAWGDHDFVYDAVGFYARELRLLDTVGATPKAFPSGIIMAALATLRRRGEAGLPFWREYAAGGGTKTGFRMCGIQALTDAVADAKDSARGRADGGATQALGLLGKGILAFEAKLSGQTYKAGKGGGVRSMREDVLLEYLRHSKEG